MFRLLTILCIIAASSAAPKPVVVYPQVLPSVYHPPAFHAPLVHPAPLAVSHVSTFHGYPSVLPVRTVLPGPVLPPAPFYY